MAYFYSCFYAGTVFDSDFGDLRRSCFVWIHTIIVNKQITHQKLRDTASTT
mgnify:CR=1 FL=1|jgi:hypothetical protein